MHRLVSLLFLLFLVSPAVSWRHGTSTSVITCNITTGVGSVNNPCSSATASTCDGVVNDSTVFTSFKTWALANQGTSRIDATINSGATCRLTGSLRWLAGIKHLRLYGYGATITGFANGFWMGGEGVSGGGARFASDVAAGASCVTLATPAEAADYPVDDWALAAGLTLQGYWQSNYGYPPNWQYFDYVKIVSSDDTSGIVCFESPLRYAYKTTWPEYDFASAGGPGALWTLFSTWDIDQEYYGLTLDQPASVGSAINSIGRRIVYHDTTFVDFPPNPTMSKTWEIYDSSMINSLEVDKLIETMVMSGVTAHFVDFQSSSIDNVTITNPTWDRMFGSGKTTTITGGTITEFGPGAYNHGYSSGLLTVTNLATTTFQLKGIGPGVISSSYAMSGGVISTPNGANISSAAASPVSGTRITVDSTAGFVSGGTYTLTGGGQSSGDWPATIVDATNFDLLTKTFVSTFTGKVQGGAVVWATPEANVFWTGEQSRAQALFRITDLTQSGLTAGTTTLLQTTDAGVFPTIPPTFPAGLIGFRTHPAPQYTGTGVTGPMNIVGANNCPAGDPLFSCFTMTFTPANLVPPAVSMERPYMWGWVTSLTWNVTQAYTSGAAATLTVKDDWPTAISGSATTYRFDPTFNLKVVGERKLTCDGTPGGTCAWTCDGVPGVCSGDTIDTPPSTPWMAELPFSGLNINNDVAAECIATPSTRCFSMTVSYRTNQGVVNP